MKFQQIPVVHSLALRWRRNAAKNASDPELPTSPEKRPAPITTPPSPKSPSKKSVRITEADSPPRRRGSDKGKGRENPAASSPAVPSASLPSPPPSPRISLRPKPANRCSSGSPTTHPAIGEALKRFGPVSIHETFECEDAVDPVRLLTLSRRTLVNETRARGGDALADEVWEYTVSKRGKTGYVVKVDYAAVAVLASQGAADPQKPVAIDIARTKGINGLMTVTSRH